MISTVKIRLGKAAINAELASSFLQKAKGLMFRPSLPESRGMLFDFGSDQKPGMWMAFMNFPIDFIWMDSQKKVICISENARPWQMRIFYPSFMARYVLEVPAGFCRINGIETGLKAIF